MENQFDIKLWREAGERKVILRGAGMEPRTPSAQPPEQMAGGGAWKSPGTKPHGRTGRDVAVYP